MDDKQEIFGLYSVCPILIMNLAHHRLRRSEPCLCKSRLISVTSM